MAKKTRSASRTKAKPSGISGKQNMYIIAGVLLAVVVGGILISQPGLLTGSQQEETAAQTEEGAAQQEEAQAAAAVSSIAVVNAPSVGQTNMPLSFAWSIDSDKELAIPHTAVHYDTKSVPSPQAYTDYRSAGRFFDGTVPGSFSDSITFQQAGNYYYRMHAVVDGKEIWSEERALKITSPSVAATTRELTITADDDSFYYNREPTDSISAKFGEKLRITFRTLTSNVYYAGLDFKSEEFGIDTGKVGPGDETEVEITVDKEGTITSYWPSSGVKKADLAVKIAG